MELYIQSCISLFNAIPRYNNRNNDFSYELIPYGCLIKRTTDFQLIKKIFKKTKPIIINKYKTSQIIDYITQHEELLHQSSIQLPFVPWTLSIIEDIPIHRLTCMAKDMLYSIQDHSIPIMKNILIIIGTKKVDLTRIKNKKTLCIFCAHHHIVPINPEDILRYIIFKTTGTVLLIKNHDIIQSIRSSDVNVADLLTDYKVALSTVFNRFKPLFLSFKPRYAAQINKISRLAKQQIRLTKQIRSPLSTFDLLRLYKHIHPPKLYLIRNGTMWCDVKYNTRYMAIKNALYERLKSRTFMVQKNVIPAIPTSRNLFSGDYPIGTVFELNTPFSISLRSMCTINLTIKSVGINTPNHKTIHLIPPLSKPRIIVCSEKVPIKISAEMIIFNTQKNIAVIPFTMIPNKQKILGVVKQNKFILLDRYINDNISFCTPLYDTILNSCQSHKTLRTMASDLQLEIKEVRRVISKNEYIKMLE